MSGKIPFVKYQGTGNDFVIVNALQAQALPTDLKAFAREICDRHFGVGSDGLIVLKQHEELDFYMDFYNPDGSQSFCGNGSRCAVHFYSSIAQKQGEIHFEAIDGKHQAHYNGDEVSIEMKLYAPIAQKQEDLILDTGSPHYLIFKDELPGTNVVEEARKIRYSDAFKEEGINVNFVKITGNAVDIQTYERGVEDETLSCGTGVTAAAIGAAEKAGLSSPVVVHARGGKLSVSFDREGDQYSRIYLKGPAVKVFEGVWEL